MKTLKKVENCVKLHSSMYREWSIPWEISIFSSRNVQLREFLIWFVRVFVFMCLDVCASWMTNFKQQFIFSLWIHS